jgi:hypothetical protein
LFYVPEIDQETGEFIEDKPDENYMDESCLDMPEDEEGYVQEEYQF